MCGSEGVDMEMGRKVRGGVEPQVKERSFGSEKEVVWALYHYMYMTSGRKVSKCNYSTLEPRR